ncbi:MAG: baseplate J/gp47 family protein [Chloroflexota bacterium]
MSAIVYLDIDDEITSAAARLRLLDADRIALVLPAGSRLATSRINFRLLAREAAARNKTLEVVTGDASARALAASAGLATHLSVAAFEHGPGTETAEADTGSGGEPRKAWRQAGASVPDDAATVVLRTGPAVVPKGRTPVPQVGPRPPSGPGPRMVVFLLILVAVLAAGGAAGLQLLPSATIVLRPSVDTIGPISLNVTAQPGITQPDPIGLLVPATTYTFDVAVSDTFPATGLNVVDTAASGEVTFSSLNTGAANPIPEGSIVKTESGIEFRTLGPVILPTAQIGIVDGRFVVVPSTRKIGVEAVSPGLAGNVPAGAIVVVPERENSKRTIVKNDAPTSGGTHMENPVVQQADIDAALRALDDALAAQFAVQLASATDVPAGTTVFPETRSLAPSSTDIDPTTLVGTEVASFQLGLTARGSVLGVNPEPVSTLAEARIRTSVDRGFVLDESSIAIKVGSPIVAGTTITFPVTVRATETRDVDEAALRAMIHGLGVPQARTVLGAYGAVTITVWPDWVTTIPTNDARLALTIEIPPGSSGSPSPSGESVP